MPCLNYNYTKPRALKIISRIFFPISNWYKYISTYIYIVPMYPNKGLKFVKLLKRNKGYFYSYLVMYVTSIIIVIYHSEISPMGILVTSVRSKEIVSLC